MNQSVFIPVSDEMLENAPQEGLPQLIPYAYQERCYRGLLEITAADHATTQSEPSLSDRKGG